MKRSILIFLVLLASVPAVRAQVGGAWTFNYAMAQPLGSTADFTENTSFLGFVVEGRKFIPGEPLTVGGELGWQTFYQRVEGQVVSRPGVDVWGTQYRYINTFAGLFNIKYHVRPERMVVPYAGIGLGPGYVYQRLDFGLWTLSDDSWRFVVRPDAGVLFQFPASNMGVNLGVNYHHFSKTKSYDETTFVGFHVGLSSFF